MKQIRITHRLPVGGETRNRRKFPYETQRSVLTNRASSSKWNKIEHRMFCHITQNWRGRPLVSHDVIIQLIANTTTQAGLTIRAELDSGQYPTEVNVSDAQLAGANMQRANFHDEWNYTLLPTGNNK